MITWQYFPKSECPPYLLDKVLEVFSKNEKEISSEIHKLSSDEVLKRLSEDLKKLNFEVEVGKKTSEKINLPVSFGRDGRVEKSFDVDGFHRSEGIILEVEAGRGVTNYQFLKDFFKALIIKDVNYVVIAVRKKYRNNKDFDVAINFLNSIYLSSRLNLPITGCLVIGY